MGFPRRLPTPGGPPPGSPAGLLAGRGGVAPQRGGVVGYCGGPSLFDFFSPYISGAQRLANGNTLICEGCLGRIFEVTSAGEVVWEYVNPYFFEDPARPGLNNAVFRAFRYTEDEIAAARRA